MKSVADFLLGFGSGTAEIFDPDSQSANQSHNYHCDFVKCHTHYIMIYNISMAPALNPP